MALKKKAWLIAYDICDPRRLGRVHCLLKKEALAMQYSIFYYEGSTEDLKSLLQTIEVRINRKVDDVRAYPIPAKMQYNCLGKSTLPEGIGFFSRVSSDLVSF
ncbi:MAG: CRISPR-associated endonuclease Cas2 [Pelistega sp.]|nr:CRISPR-associated endonuclease Cas2 [Pelistega sp.]